MKEQILNILQSLDFSFGWQILIPGFIVTILELCLSADNCGALTEMVSEHNPKDQKWLVKNQLLTGTLINIPMIVFVMVAKQFPLFENPLQLVLGGLLMYVFVKQGWEIMSHVHKDPDTNGTEINEVEIPLLTFQKKLALLVGLNIQSMPFLIDSVPLAATVTSNLFAITIGILLNRTILVLISDYVVDFFRKYTNILWGVMCFIGFSAIHAMAFSVLEWFHYELFEFDIPGEISLLGGSIILGVLTYDKVYVYVQENFVKHETEETKTEADAIKA
jgi:predicted tellurium resistance membrane protein TerC